MVTGTVRSSGPASIITGVTSRAGVERGQMRQIFGMAGKAETGIVERLLGDRAGDDRGGVAGKAVGDGAVDRLDGAGGIGRVRPAGTVDEAGRERHDGQGALKDAAAACAGVVSRDRHVGSRAGARARRSAPDRRADRRRGTRQPSRSLPRGNGDFRPDAGRIADAQRQRKLCLTHGYAGFSA